MNGKFAMKIEKKHTESWFLKKKEHCMLKLSVAARIRCRNPQMKQGHQVNRTQARPPPVSSNPPTFFRPSMIK
jgi:hypothetical protein